MSRAGEQHSREDSGTHEAYPYLRQLSTGVSATECVHELPVKLVVLGLTLDSAFLMLSQVMLMLPDCGPLGGMAVDEDTGHGQQYSLHGIELILGLRLGGLVHFVLND